ncbi:pLS20_p028 family conjugation system transmembrane protein [Staphylococcus caprae]|uniref:pLS20_p028 family conjugation system transmembrane protein n=1 Tax=Staphylococcus caprae TaxID=29380 RepID=UPI000CD04B79|nr:hypothetical protein [Staphylococcus caprae]POA06072.1 hypothetical protein CD155_03765 [Staphylococcus caprae]SUL89859.1 Uncharacterised protein [Staphylococcus caprae]
MNQWVNYLMLNDTDADKKLENIDSKTQESIYQILSNNLDLFQASWLGNLFKILGWLITWLFYWITQMMLNTLKNIFTLGGLLDNKEVTHLSHQLMPIALSIMLITVAAIGLMMMTGKRIQISNVFVNLILAICFITMIPYLFHTLSDMTNEFVKGQDQITEKMSYSKEDKDHNKNMDLPSRVIKMNVVDLADYANKDFPSRKKVKPKDLNHLYVPNNSTSIFDSFDYSEKVKPFYQGEDDDNIGYHEILKMESKKEMGKNKKPNDLLQKNIIQQKWDEGVSNLGLNKFVPNGNTKTAKQKRDIIRNGVFDYQINYDRDAWHLTPSTDKDKDKLIYSRMAPSEDSGAFKAAAGILKFFDEYPLRYQANFLVLWLSLGGLAIVYLFSAFKVVKLMFDIAFQKVLTPFVAATDLTTGQKMKSLFSNIVLNYAVIWLIFVLFIIYNILITAVMNSNAGMAVKAIAFIALSIACIDGPDTAKRVLGIDTGVQDGKAAAFGAYGLGRATAKTASAGVSGSKSLYNSMTGGKKTESSNSNSMLKSDNKVSNGNSDLEPTDLSQYDMGQGQNKNEQFEGGQSTSNNDQKVDDASQENKNISENADGDQNATNAESSPQDVENQNEQQADQKVANEDETSNLENGQQGVNEGDQQGIANDQDQTEATGINENEKETNGLSNNQKPGINEESTDVNDLENNEQTGINEDNQEVQDLENTNQPGVNDGNDAQNGLENTHEGNTLENNEFDSETKENVKGMNGLNNQQQPDVSNDMNNEYMQENAQGISYPNNNNISESNANANQQTSEPHKADNISSPSNRTTQPTSAPKEGSVSGSMPNKGQSVTTPRNNYMQGDKQSPNVGSKASSPRSASNASNTQSQGRQGLSYSEAKSKARQRRSVQSPTNGGINRPTGKMNATDMSRRVPSNLGQASSNQRQKVEIPRQHRPSATHSREGRLSYSEAKSRVKSMNTHPSPNPQMQRPSQMNQAHSKHVPHKSQRSNHMAQQAPSMDKAMNKAETTNDSNTKSSK